MTNSADPDQLIWIYTVCKGRAYPGSVGPGLSDCTPKLWEMIVNLSWEQCIMQYSNFNIFVDKHF